MFSQAVELMAIDAMCHANSAFKIAESIQSAAEFWKVQVLYHLAEFFTKAFIIVPLTLSVLIYSWMTQF